HQRLQPVEAIDNDGLEIMLRGQQFLEHAKHVVQVSDDARRGKFDVCRRALAFRAEIKRAGELSRQAGLSDTVHAIQKNDGRVVSLGGFQAAKADSHSYLLLWWCRLGGPGVTLLVAGNWQRVNRRLQRLRQPRRTCRKIEWRLTQWFRRKCRYGRLRKEALWPERRRRLVRKQ